MAQSAESIVQSVSTKVAASRVGHIVDLHDGGPDKLGEDRKYTVAAMRILLERYSALGRRFVAIPELEVGH